MAPPAAACVTIGNASVAGGVGGVYACASVGVSCVINASLVCDGSRDCPDGSDEDFTHALCYSLSLPLSAPVVAGLVVAAVLALSLVSCAVGAAVNCFLHMHKYWCSCTSCASCSCSSSPQNSGGRNTKQTLPPHCEMTVFQNHNFSVLASSPSHDLSPRSPSYCESTASHHQDKVLLVRAAVPSQYSTFAVSPLCERCSRYRHSTPDHLLIPSDGRGSRAVLPVRSHSSQSAGGLLYSAQIQHGSQSVPANLTLIPGTALGDQIRILIPPLDQLETGEGVGVDGEPGTRRMPPSYSSLFRQGCALLIGEETSEGFVAKGSLTPTAPPEPV